MTRKTQFITIGLTLTLLSGALVGCTGPSKATKAADDSYMLSGKVVETMDAAGYTYICLEKDGKKTWAAAPTTKVTVGQEIKLLNGAQMTNFQSKALNRTFDTIIFSGGVKQDQPATPAAKKAKVAPNVPVVDGLLEGTIIETMNAANYTYIQLQKGDRQSWAAIPLTTLYVGDEVELQPGSEMGNFNSKTLNRSFDNITFSGGLKSLKSKNPVPEAQPKTEAAAPAAPVALPAGHPKLGADTKAAAAAPVAPDTITGKVSETMNSGGYTYLCLESEGKKTWAAVPATEVKVGQELTIAAGQAMTNFSSKSLNRTFDSIIFSNGIVTK
jgi:hypothetical protein